MAHMSPGPKKRLITSPPTVPSHHRGSLATGEEPKETSTAAGLRLADAGLASQGLAGIGHRH
eukprot:CAMPEP_0174728664 /NCGR_PEP_ID=MMETSP1094-20130205/52172_1 /TAXON_ID=156173 /ORGANISM="Chrysochromulina brevifilum, Strain UTEX LB 985" /LENGTH=61 /DNA_ID=CAMNT_0015930633 /DNA_START=395 /DNA_END=580 /DNA_ORIENTATION=+